jgi:hypothetical protein
MQIHSPNTETLKSAVRNVPYRLAVLGFAAAAIGSLAMNYTDTRSTVGYTQVCFKPTNPKVLAKAKKQGKQYCTASQRYWISDPILREWETKEPEFYGKLTRLKTIPPTNQYKWVYGAIAMGSGLMVAGLGAARLNLINKLAPGYRKEVQALWHRDAVRNGVQMASDAIDGRYAVQRKLAFADTEYGRYQAAILTPEELEAMGQQQAFLDAEYMARATGEKEAGTVAGTEQAQLPGQSLDDITSPHDKVSATDAHASIKPALIQTLEQSQISPILKAGVLKVIGGQGSGKTTLVNGGLLRYRLHCGHKLMVINSHKSFDMYRGLEPHLEAGTEFYAVGGNDQERGKSLVAGMTKVLAILEKRYTEYQNQPVGTYNHYPITILIEECGEWSGLLGEKTLPMIQHFWQKMFIACRKAKLFPIITAQDDTMTMFGNPKGLAELIKSTGSVTLNLIAQPDASSPDGWKPSGKGLLYIPNQDAQKVNVPNIRNLVASPDIFDDLTAPKQQTNSQTATPNKEDKRQYLERVYDMEFEIDKPKSTPRLSANAQIVLEILKASTKEYISFDGIRTSRKWNDNKPTSDVLRSVLTELLTAEKITGDDASGYKAID